MLLLTVPQRRGQTVFNHADYHRLRPLLVRAFKGIGFSYGRRLDGQTRGRADIHRFTWL